MLRSINDGGKSSCYRGVERKNKGRCMTLFFDDEKFCEHLLEKHKCVLKNGILQEKTGCFQIGDIPEDEALVAAAVYVHLYYEKGVDYSTAIHCALGFVGRIISMEEWRKRWENVD